MTPDPVVKESLTTERDTAYREGFEACREMAAKASDAECVRLQRAGWPNHATVAYDVAKIIRALPTPATKG